MSEHFDSILSSHYPILEPFELIRLASQERITLFLQRLLLAHNFALFRDKEFAVDNLIHKHVQNCLET